MRVDVTDTATTLKDLLETAGYIWNTNIDGFKTILISNNYIGCGGVHVDNWPVMFEGANARIQTGVDTYGKPIYAPAIDTANSMQLEDWNDIAIRTEDLSEIQLVACPGHTVPLYIALT